MNDEQPGSLELAISSLPEPKSWPMALPPVHLNIARSFSKIVADQQLEPQPDAIFGEDLLYLFYGGVFYRTERDPTRNTDELPIAFLFDPSVLPRCCRYYPFDTGALANGLYREAGKPLLPFETTYRLTGGDDVVPTRMVYYLYESNQRYLRGEISDGLKNLPHPLPQLAAFFSTDLTAHRVDHRQMCIECHFNQPLPLAQGLLWIGFPDSMTDIFARLYEVTRPSIPEYFPYEYHCNFSPADIAAKLELEAAKVVRRFGELPRPRGH